jgi:CRISPR-associated endoribonuclease Cas6
MRFNISLESVGDQVLEIDHLYANSAWVYSTLRVADEAYSKNLHDSKAIKGFCFSSIYVPNSKAVGKVIPIKKSTVCNIDVAMSDDTMIQKFTEGMGKNQIHKIGNAFFKFTGMQSSERILPNYYRCRLITPVVIADEQAVNERGEVYQKFLHPEDSKYQQLFFSNLNRKAGNILTDEELSKCKLEIVGDMESKLMKINGRDIKGYRYSFRLKCPNILLNVGYTQGFGRFNAQGFGFAK